MQTTRKDFYISMSKVLSNYKFEELSQDDFVRLVCLHSSSKQDEKKIREVWYELSRECGSHNVNWW